MEGSRFPGGPVPVRGRHAVLREHRIHAQVGAHDLGLLEGTAFGDRLAALASIFQDGAGETPESDKPKAE